MVLCLAMMLSIMVVGAGAAFADQDQIDTKHTEAVDMCNALNIITGFENGKFMPKVNVTREQMAKMICVLDNGGKEPQLSAGTTFSDVALDRWSNKYIESCASRGIVVGVGGGKFAPAGKVTATQAAKMLLVELGYDDDLQQYSGSDWATKVNIDATKKGFYNDLEDIDVNAPLTREHAAQMIWNALQANEVEYSYTLVTNPDGSITSKVTVGEKKDGNDPISLLEDKYNTIDTDATTGIMTAIKYNSTKDEWKYTIQPLNDNHALGTAQTYTTDKDFTALFGHKVSFVVKDNNAHDVYGAFTDESEVVVSGVMGDIGFDDITFNANRASGSIEVDDTDYDVDPMITVAAFTNVDNTAGYARYDDLVAVKAIPAYFEYSAIDWDDNDEIDLVIVYPVAFGKITSVGSDNVRLNEVTDVVTGKVLPNGTKLDTEDDYTLYDGAVKDDYALITPDKTLKTLGDITLLGKETGKVESYSGTDAVIDGNTYAFDSLSDGKDAAGNPDGTPNDQAKVTSSLNKTVAFRSINDYLVWIDASGTVDLSDYVLVTGVAQAKSSSGYYEADVLFTSGDTEPVKVKSVDIGGTKYVNGTPAAGEQALTYNKIQAGGLYTYEISSGKYELTLVTNLDHFDGRAFNYNIATQTQDVVTNSWQESESTSDANAKVKVTDGSTSVKAKFAADAVVFVLDDGDYTVKTGADLAKVTDGNAKVHFAGAEKDSTTNAMTVTFAFVETDATSSSDWQYGYITSKITHSKDADGTYEKATIWNGETSDELSTKDKLSFPSGTGKGSIVKYKLNESGAISDFETITLVPGAVTVINADDSLKIGTTDANNDSSAADYTIDDDDTTVLWIDSDAIAGVATGSYSTAKNHYNASDAIDGLTYNVYYVVDTPATPASGSTAAKDAVLGLLVVDVNDDLYSPTTEKSLGDTSVVNPIWYKVVPASASNTVSFETKTFDYIGGDGGSYKITISGQTVKAGNPMTLTISQVNAASNTAQAFYHDVFTFGLSANGPVEINSGTGRTATATISTSANDAGTIIHPLSVSVVQYGQ